MRLLLTNDDGIHAQGTHVENSDVSALAKEMIPVAPFPMDLTAHDAIAELSGVLR